MKPGRCARRLEHTAAHIASHAVIPVTLIRIPVHQRSRIERMVQTTYLMFESEAVRAAHRIDDVGEAVLMRFLAIGQLALGKPCVRFGEACDIDLDVMPSYSGISASVSA